MRERGREGASERERERGSLFWRTRRRERDLSVEPLVVHGVPGGLATGRLLVRADVPAKGLWG